jgi:hypothetical protein
LGVTAGSAVAAGVLLGSVLSLRVDRSGDERVVDAALEYQLRTDLEAIVGRGETVAAWFREGSVRAVAAREIAGRARVGLGRLDAATVVVVEQATQPPATETTDPPLLGADRVVSPRGDDTASGAPGTPWRTVQRALDAALPGETVEIEAGEYVGELRLTRSLLAAQPITIRARRNALVVVRPAVGAGDRSALRVYGGAAHWRFEKIAFSGATGPSTANIYGYGGASDITFTGVEVTGSERQGVFLDRSTSRWTFRDSRVHRNGGKGPQIQDHGLYLQGTGHLVEDTVVEEHPNGFGVQIYPFARSVTVRGGVISRALKSGVIVGQDARDTTIEDVAFRGPFGDGLAVDSYRLGGGGNNVVRRNNADFAGAFTPKPGLTYTANTP